MVARTAKPASIDSGDCLSPRRGKPWRCMITESPQQTTADLSVVGPRSTNEYRSVKNLIGRVVLAGVCLRLLVFCFLGPLNNDGAGHLEHIHFVRDTWKMPPAGLGHETWQPPLYYYVAALVATVTHNVKAIQLLSLLTSVGTLIVGRRLICSSSLIATAEAKLIALSLVSFLPQFVMFGLYVSNDSLAIYLGFLLIHKFRRLIYRPSFSSALLVIAIASLGLLTKGQFVGIVPLTFLFGLLLIWKRRIEIEHRGALLVLAALLGGSGLAKYVQNTLVYGSPFLSNLDFNPEWLAAQQGTYLGLAAALDINFLKLIFEPTVAESTKH